MQYDIFISYKRKGTSSATAAYLYELLLRKGYNVFFDRKEMRSGKFNEQLLEHIAAAKDVIILLEDESLQSWFAHKDDAPRHRIVAPGRSGHGDEPVMSMDMPEEAPYMTDWFCREVMHALSFGQDKNVIPLLLNGYQMPASDDLPPEMKDLAMLQALSLEISEIEETYQKYFVEKEYLKSKPRNLAISRQYQQRGGVIGSFLFYTEAESCELFECGERIITLTDDNDEDHPFRLPVTFAGEHRFRIINNDTCEELRIAREIETNHQRYIHVEWSADAPRLWALSDADIAAQPDADTLFRWGRGLFEGTAKNAPDIHRAILCLERAVAQGHPAASEFVKDHGQGLVAEWGAKRADAFRWYTMSAKMGNAKSKNLLGYYYKNGQGMEQYDAKAVDCCMESAAQGDAVAQGILGNMYRAGFGVEQDDAKALEWYTKAAAQGDVDAQRLLGKMYRGGSGVEQDDAQAAEWYAQAAAQGDAVAQGVLGSYYARGLGVEQDYAVAAEWYAKSAVQGDVEAQRLLGTLYAKGRGVAKDYAVAAEWYAKAAAQGNASAQRLLGALYANGLGVERDYAVAAEWYAKAAAQGDAVAQRLLGTLYAKGLSVERDYAVAAEWYAKAAAQGDAVAQRLLGTLYAKGRGVAQDYAKAVEWYTKAAEQGDADAYNSLAWTLHLLGRHEEALPWAEKAVEAKPDDANVLDTLATVHQGLGRLDEALAEFRRCLELEEAAGADEADLAETRAKIAAVEALIAQQ